MILDVVRKFVVKTKFSVLVATAVMYASCSKENTIASVSSTTAPKKLASISDEDVFRGVMYLEGPVAAMIGDYSQFNFRSYMTDPVQIDEATAMQDAIIDHIQADFPNYMSDFRTSITSGNLNTVKAALEDAAAKVLDASVEIANLDKNQTLSDAAKVAQTFTSQYALSSSSSKKDVFDAGYDYGMKSNIIKNINAAIQINVAIVIFVVVLVAFYFLAANPGSPFDNSFLNDDIATEITLSLNGI